MLTFADFADGSSVSTPDAAYRVVVDRKKNLIIRVGYNAYPSPRSLPAGGGMAIRVVQAIVPMISSTDCRLVSGWRKAKRAIVSPSQPVGATKAVWPARRRADRAA